MADIGKFYSGTIFELNGESVNYKAEIQFNEISQCLVKIYGVERERREKLGNSENNHAIIRLNEGGFITIFYFYVKQGTGRLQYDNDKPIRTGFDLTIISSNVIMGVQGFPLEYKFSEMCMEITDGHELIGKCPYDLESGYMEMATYKNINIPIVVEPICASTTLGIFQFETLPQYFWNRESLNIGLSHKIIFKPTEPLRVNDLHKTLNEIIDFFTLLSGETITINKLELIERKKEQFDSFKFIGYCNYPKERLNVLDNRGIDTTSFKRISLFKLTDFSDLKLAMDYWFEHYNALFNAQQAYGRIILDEEVKITTMNKFLAAMQMIEGYSQAFVNKEQEIAEFNMQKQSIMAQLKDEADKKLVEKGLGFSGISFRKALTNYFFEAIRCFTQISKTAFNKKYDGLLDDILNDRNFYTHSSNQISAKLNFSEAMGISGLCKDFYRALVLTQMGMPESVLYHRLSHNRMTAALLINLLDLDIRADGASTVFDSDMWCFSDDNR